MKLELLTDVKFAHNGHRVVSYITGDIVDATDQEFINCVLEEGWARPVIEKAIDRAPHNKAIVVPQNKRRR